MECSKRRRRVGKKYKCVVKHKFFIYIMRNVVFAYYVILKLWKNKSMRNIPPPHNNAACRNRININALNIIAAAMISAKHYQLLCVNKFRKKYDKILQKNTLLGKLTPHILTLKRL